MEVRRRGRRRAAAGFANVVAAELYERALAAADLDPTTTCVDRARVLEALGDMRANFGAYEPALEAYERARNAHGGSAVDCTRVMVKIAGLPR